MHVCLVARNRFHGDRKARATHHALAQAGHEVSIVAVDGKPPSKPVTRTISSQVWTSGVLGRRANRLVPAGLANRVRDTRLADAAADIAADVYLPLHDDVLGVAITAARRVGGVVQRAPEMDHAGHLDLVDLAPSRPDLALPEAGLGRSFTPGWSSPPYEPEAGRHSGGRAVICYRKTEWNPGRYLESALRRSGMDVRVETDSIDLSTVEPNTAFVLFVEGPYPAIEVTGSTRVPTLFWVHHGEHHLHANLRLTNLYRADATLLAHSWHLAHWFPAPVHRFPFAVPRELFAERKPIHDRQFDVAMVGSKLRESAWQYRRRRELIHALESHLSSDRVRFIEGLSPEDMASIYSESRIVLNEGGARHHPITMRIFEAVGAGAVLLTDPAPGLEVLFEPDRDYVILSDDVVADVRDLVHDLDRADGIARDASERATRHHTYDHRVDLLIEIAGQITKRELPPPPQRDELARLVAGDVEVQRILHDDVDGLENQLPDREVWSLSERRGRMRRRNMDAVVMAGNQVEDMEPLLESARRYIYTAGEVAGLEDYLRANHPDAVRERHGRLTRVDLMTEAYRVGPAGSP